MFTYIIIIKYIDFYITIQKCADRAPDPPCTLLYETL